MGGWSHPLRGVHLLEQAVQRLACGRPDAILVDGNRCPAGLKADTTEVVVKGDAKCISIAAASILAKVRMSTL